MVVQRKSFRGCQELKTKAYEICGARKKVQISQQNMPNLARILNCV